MSFLVGLIIGLVVGIILGALGLMFAAAVTVTRSAHALDQGIDQP